MGNKKIIEGNKLIAEFMGAQIIPIEKFGGDVVNRFDFPDGEHQWEHHLQYHISWDWLMPVFKEFTSLQGQKMPSFINHVRTIEAFVTRVDIDSAFKYLAEGIKWYNENKS